MTENVQHFYDIKSAMRYINNAEEEIIIRKNKFYNKENKIIAIVHLIDKDKIKK